MTLKFINPKTGETEEVEKIESYFGKMAAIKYKGRIYYERDFETEYGKTNEAS